MGEGSRDGKCRVHGTCVKIVLSVTSHMQKGSLDPKCSIIPLFPHPPIPKAAEG